MIRFAGSSRETGRPVLGIGLSRENCDRLLKGEPIYFNTTHMALLPDIELFIVGGETDQEMAQVMIDTAGIRPDQIRDDSELDGLPRKVN